MSITPSLTNFIPFDTVRAFADFWDSSFNTYRTNLDTGLGVASGNEIEFGDCDCSGVGNNQCDIDTKVYKMKVPIGVKSKSRTRYDAPGISDGCRTGIERNFLEYRRDPFHLNEFTFDDQLLSGYPSRMTDEVATLCAGGYRLGKDQYLKTDSERMNEVNYSSGWVPTNKSNECALFFNNADKENGSTCESGLNGRDCNDSYYTVSADWPAFCQMGDYIETTPECVDQCKNIVSPTAVPDEGGNYCHFAKDRICSKQRVPYHDPTKESLKYVNILKRGSGIVQQNRSIVLGYKDRVLAFYT